MSKHSVAQDELRKIMSEQQTVSVAKLRRIFDTLNIPYTSDVLPDSVEVTYLKNEIKKRDKKLSWMGNKLKTIQDFMDRGGIKVG